MVSYFLIFLNFVFFYFFFLMIFFSLKKPVRNKRIKKNIKYYVLIPCLNEASVIARTLQSFPVYPKSQLEIIVVDDGSDDGTPDIVESLGFRVIRRTLPNARKGKGKALNYAVNILRKELQLFPHSRVVIGVFDGDGNPSDELFHEVHSWLVDDSVGAVQTGVRIRNKGKSLANVQDVEFRGLVGMLQGMRTESDGAILGGNGQFIRLSVLDSLGREPWTDSLTEDLDIGIRILLLGQRVIYSRRSWVTQQAVEDLPRYIKQRTRWSQGNFQALKYIPRVVFSKLNFLTKLEICYTLSQPILALALPVVLIFLINLHSIVFLLGMVLLVDVYLCLSNRVWNPKTILTFCGMTSVYFYINYLAFYRHLSKATTWAKTERVVE